MNHVQFIKYLFSTNTGKNPEVLSDGAVFNCDTVVMATFPDDGSILIFLIRFKQLPTMTELRSLLSDPTSDLAILSSHASAMLSSRQHGVTFM